MPATSAGMTSSLLHVWSISKIREAWAAMSVDPGLRFAPIRATELARRAPMIPGTGWTAKRRGQQGQTADPTLPSRQPLSNGSA